jgi:nucleotide-binding universal stress UspA family protein
MFRTVMVPLDRSPFAEHALPLALSIARRAGARLDLASAHVVYALTEDPNYGGLPFDPCADAECRKREQLYLDATAKWLVPAHSVTTTTAVVDGMAADGLLERAGVDRADLIVMTTHGRGPVSRLFLGSVADELMRRSRVPVLLVRPVAATARQMAEPVFDNIVIPLDGSALAEQVLPPALELARLMEAHVRLLRVVEYPSAQAEAEAYLETRARPARQQRLRVQTRVMVAPHAASAILKEGEALTGNLLALATRGHGGLRRLLLGSVADKVIRGAVSPVLVYHPR